MPELPDVEEFKKRFDGKALNKRIKDIEIFDHTIMKVGGDKFRFILEGNKFIESKRHGKYLFSLLELGKIQPVFHFGMTGNIAFLKDKDSRFPEHTRVAFYFAKGCLAYVCQRKLGSIYLTDDISEFLRERDLGPDALQVSFSEFHEIFKDKRGMLKSRLMNQSYIAGIGNVYADEICFHVRLHPRKKVNNFNKNTWKRIYENMTEVLEEASQRNKSHKSLPDTWLLNNRSEGEDCPLCQGIIKRTEVAGRGTYFCPKCQRK